LTVERNLKRVTIKDVAKMAGVSYQTVSLVLNHPEMVAEKTLKKVRETIAAFSSASAPPTTTARSRSRTPTGITWCRC
jgi:DNA-binding LacI/PurR family transcriptional regulator